MSNLITTGCFIGDIVIPNLTVSSVQQRIQKFIDKYEVMCLVKILGYPMYKDWLANPTSASNVALKNGAEYTNVYGFVQKWQGLLPSNPNESLIAQFIYTKIIEDDILQNTGYGVIKMKPSESVGISPSERIIRTWNDFSHQVLQLVDYLATLENSLFTLADYSNAVTFAYPINFIDL
jgi:hypothetical protein